MRRSLPLAGRYSPPSRHLKILSLYKPKVHCIYILHHLHRAKTSFPWETSDFFYILNDFGKKRQRGCGFGIAVTP